MHHITQFDNLHGCRHGKKRKRRLKHATSLTFHSTASTFLEEGVPLSGAVSPALVGTSLVNSRQGPTIMVSCDDSKRTGCVGDFTHSYRINRKMGGRKNQKMCGCVCAKLKGWPRKIETRNHQNLSGWGTRKNGNGKRKLNQEVKFNRRMGRMMMMLMLMMEGERKKGVKKSSRDGDKSSEGKNRGIDSLAASQEKFFLVVQMVVSLEERGLTPC